MVDVQRHLEVALRMCHAHIFATAAAGTVRNCNRIITYRQIRERKIVGRNVPVANGSSCPADRERSGTTVDIDRHRSVHLTNAVHRSRSQAKARTAGDIDCFYRTTAGRIQQRYLINPAAERGNIKIALTNAGAPRLGTRPTHLKRR